MSYIIISGLTSNTTVISAISLLHGYKIFLSTFSIFSPSQEYPPPPGKQLASSNPDSYLEAEAKLKELKEAEPHKRHRVVSIDPVLK